MAVASSSMHKLGTIAATFSLPEVRSADPLQLSDFAAKPMLLMFICNHCPYVIHLIESLVELANQYQKLGYAVIAISSNDVDRYPQDGPEKMRSFAERYGFEFPYCYDQSQQVAMAYGAECTPDFFVYDRERFLRYRGQFDASRPGKTIAVTGVDLRAALDAVLKETPVSDLQIPSIGCSIKWIDSHRSRID